MSDKGTISTNPINNLPLKESEVFYRYLAELTPESLVIHKDGKIIYANPSTLKLVGAKKTEELIGKSIMQFVHPDSKEMVVRRVKMMLEHRKVAPMVEEKFIDLQGKTLIAQVKAVPFVYQGNLAILTILHDITKQKAVEQQLKESEERFRAMIENSFDVVALISPEGKRLYVTNSIKRVLGFSPKEFIGVDGFARIHPDDQQKLRKLLAHVLQKPGISATAEYRVMDKKGKWKWVEGSSTNMTHIPTVNAVVVNYHDITERKEADQRLWEANQTLGAIIQASPLGVYVVDTKGNVVMWNKIAENMFGWKEKEIIGQHLPIVQHGKTTEHKALMRTLLQGNTFTKETLRMKKDGTIFPVSISAAPIFDEHGKVVSIVAITADITERKKIEEELYVSKNQLEITLQNVADGITVQDNTGKLIFANKKAIEMNGYTSHDEMLTAPLLDYLQKFTILDEQGKPFSPVRLPGRRAIAGEKNPQELLQFIENKTGVKRWAIVKSTAIYDKQHKPIMVVNTFHDITEQKVANERLLHQLEVTRTITDNAASALFLLNEHGIVTYMNPAAEKMTGFTIHEIKSKRLHDFIHKYREDGTQYPAEECPVWQGYKKMEPLAGEDLFVRKNGTFFPVTFSVSPIVDNGTLIEAVLEVQDITERKAYERQKDEFIGIVSHELKTPVTSLKAYEQVLLKRFSKQGNEQAAALLLRMDLQINKLTTLIGDLLDITKMEAGKLRFHQDYFYFDELVNQIVEEVQLTTEKHTLILEGISKKTLYADKDRIGQVLTNFLTNAIKYSPDTQNIIVKVSATQQTVEVTVQDFGIGIPKEELPYVFDRFFRVEAPVHKTIPGLGLGLYISKEIIERQGGTVWVESETGKGSTFGFALPIKNEST